MGVPRKLCLCAILLNKMLRCSEAFTTFIKSNHCTLVHRLGDLTIVDSTWLVDFLVLIPWI
mgnify:CR=1 FL=1